MGKNDLSLLSPWDGFLLLHRISCAVLQVLMASHHGYAMWVVIVYQFINNAQSRTRTTDKKQLLWLCVSKKAMTYAGVSGDCEAARFFVKFQSPTDLWEALAGSQFTIEHLDGRRLLYAPTPLHETIWWMAILVWISARQTLCLPSPSNQ